MTVMQTGAPLGSIIADIGAAIFVFMLIALVFSILLGCLFYFTHYNEGWGKKMLVNGVLGLIVIAILYMTLFNTSTLPDISAWFQEPDWVKVLAQGA